MRSVADVLKQEDRRMVDAFAPAERVALALALGRRDLDTFTLGQGASVDREEARRLVERRRQAGRRHSRCLEELIG
jgi:hypothetical protein